MRALLAERTAAREAQARHAQQIGAALQGLLVT
jgi:hypothetical protein